MNREWNLLNTDEDFKFTFSNHELITYFNETIVVSNSQFYLSNNNCQNFNNNNVGLNLTGEYLITEGGCYLINFINNVRFELTPLTNSTNPETVTLVTTTF